MNKEEAQQRVSETCSVSRETIDLLERFARGLEKWNRKINLVAPSTIPDLWSRHILDSAQLFNEIPRDAPTLCDIGSGGGLPGIVIAIIAKETSPGLQVALVESDKRKCAFLQTMVAHLGLSATVLVQRIEEAAPQSAEIVTSRALAPLNQLLGYVERHLAKDGKALLLKGAKYEEELDEALASWSFDLQKRPSETSADAVVLEISSLGRR
jgi:16S rRNA (guanine527-N7)-methyltransferase